MSQAPVPPSPQGLREQLFGAGYIADEDVASLVWMALSLERPMLIEGEAGVGKTAIAAACARALGRPLLRLQCYEGLDLGQAVYEWNYSRQLLEIRLTEAGAGAAANTANGEAAGASGIDNQHRPAPELLQAHFLAIDLQSFKIVNGHVF